MNLPEDSGNHRKPDAGPGGHIPTGFHLYQGQGDPADVAGLQLPSPPGPMPAGVDGSWEPNVIWDWQKSPTPTPVQTPVGLKLNLL